MHLLDLLLSEIERLKYQRNIRRAVRVRRHRIFSDKELTLFRKALLPAVDDLKLAVVVLIDDPRNGCHSRLNLIATQIEFLAGAFSSYLLHPHMIRTILLPVLIWIRRIFN